MLEFLNLPEIQGITIGFLTFVIIGTFHPIVIKAEYYFSHIFVGRYRVARIRIFG